MTKVELKQKATIKECYGTNEWSDNSGICCNCKLKEDCGKVNSNRNK
ncbi:hypothetical protein HN451_05290 [archaeon]|jgi:hypothetical protein|nr:hypothetical protein [archaeon]